VTNVRGGSVVIKRISQIAVVAVESAGRFLLRTYPFYKPRKQTKRTRWTIYSSLSGTFYKGKVRGVVSIRFLDDHFYEGPYIDEEHVSEDGTVPPEARAKNHWGIFKCNNGRIFEGSNVDNHFDPENIQGHYLCRLPNGDVYEGNFLDEHLFGPGKMSFADGSEYEGEWHLDKMSGHGHMRNIRAKWTYEGIMDDNLRNSEGTCVWDDGSVYLGEWKADKMVGRGIYVSRLKDIYKGEFADSVFEGKGELVYNNGGHYRGSFSKGLRHGEGHFINNKGTEYLGFFYEDKRHGEFTVKKKLPPEPGSDEVIYEFQTATYDMGKFVSWANSAVNPNATRQFIRIFEEDREAFNSVYAMILAKYMPKTPNGIDAAHPEVVKILARIRAEGGQLVASSSYNDSKAVLEKLIPDIKAVKKEISVLKETLDSMGLQNIKIEKEKADMMRNYESLMEQHGAVFQKIEQFWVDDTTETRPRHQATIDRLKVIKSDEWFKLKNHRIPPPFLKKIMDTVCSLLSLPLDWKFQRLLLSDSVYNAIEGDADAARFKYDAKLNHILQNYDIYDHARPKQEEDDIVASSLTDPRFRRDSYYVESCGDAAPYLVDWIKANWAYKLTARKMLADIKFAENKKMQASRVLKTHQKTEEDQRHLIAKLERQRAAETAIKEKLSVFQAEMSKHAKIMNFVNETALLNRKDEADFDYYEMLEKAIEQKQDRLAVEGTLEDALKGVVARHDKEVAEKTRQLLAYGEKYVEPEPHVINIRSTILDCVSHQQNSCIMEGWHLGYSIEPQEYVMPEDKVQDNIDIIVDNVALEMNKVMNDILSIRHWKLLDGRLITQRFLYVFAWTHWIEMARDRELQNICDGWEAIFNYDRDMSLRKALEATINTRMSAKAREQGKTYRLKNAEAIAETELKMSDEFEAMYPTGTAMHALTSTEDEAGDVEPNVKISAICWIKFHPSKFNEIRDQRNQILATEFSKRYSKDTALKAFEILNGISDAAMSVYAQQADCWRSFNSDVYHTVENEELTRMADEYKREFPSDTYRAAAKHTDNSVLYGFIRDAEVAAEHFVNGNVVIKAKAWAAKNQGLMRKGMSQLQSESEALSVRQWFELIDVTQDFQKGSYLYVTEEDKLNIVSEKFYGFRQRLEKRYAWLIAYYMKRYDELSADLEAILLEDPNMKVYHNIRPSKESAIQKAHEQRYYNKKKSTEAKHQQIAQKIALWNTYFGTPEERGLDKETEKPS
jgi:hypothetical protein